MAVRMSPCLETTSALLRELIGSGFEWALRVFGEYPNLDPIIDPVNVQLKQVLVNVSVDYEYLFLRTGHTFLEPV